MNTPEDDTRATTTDEVTVSQIPGKGRGVIALCAFAAGECVMVGKASAVVAKPTVYSVQVGNERHVELAEPATYSNHGCNPNCGLRDNEFGAYDFIAMRPIVRGEEILWDYAMSEYELSAPFECRCGARACRGRVSGFRNLSAEHVASFGDLYANYLRSLT